jgi:hypothetical protein
MLRPMRGSTLTFAAILLATGSAASADDSICADRPGKSSETCTTPPGHWQVETGLADWSLERSGGERDTSLVVGETTIKYGLSDRTDIEVDVTPWQRQSNRIGNFHDGENGVGDVRVQYKQQLTAPGSALQVSAYPYLKIPAARKPLGNGKWEAGLLLPIGYSIPKSPISIGLTPEVDLTADSDGHGYHPAMVQVAEFGWQANDALNLSAELWGRWDWDPAGAQKQLSADGAAAYLVNHDVQLDAGLNLGLNRQTPDVELYAGVSKRF